MTGTINSPFITGTLSWRHEIIYFSPLTLQESGALNTGVRVRCWHLDNPTTMLCLCFCYLCTSFKIKAVIVVSAA